jgi:hypothetical protein
MKYTTAGQDIFLNILKSTTNDRKICPQIQFYSKSKYQTSDAGFISDVV